MELVENHIHGLFAEWGIRFVATVDNVDWTSGQQKARQINGLVNEWYLEDLSENICTVHITSAGRDNTPDAGSLYTPTGKTRRIK